MPGHSSVAQPLPSGIGFASARAMPSASVSHARPRGERKGLRKTGKVAGRASDVLRDNGLSLVLLALFVVCWLAQIATGFSARNEELKDHGLRAISLVQYVSSGHFLEATFENWESEFLQMGLFVLLTVRLYQRGSSESNPPEKKEEERPSPAAVPSDAPWPMRRGGWARKLYEHSLSLVLLALFAVSFALHAWGGFKNDNEERALSHLPLETFGEFIGSAQFWFESFQNWQSEFLAVLSIVVLSIFLRERGSAQSKELTTPHHVTEA
jgi:hypothetical protein